MSDNSVVFRRIRGRVVPMRKHGATDSKRQPKVDVKRDIASGSAMVASGIAAAAGGGRAYKALISSATRIAGKASQFQSKFQDRIIRSPDAQLTFDRYLRSKRANEKALGAMNKALKLSKFGGTVRRASKLGGAALVGFGATKIAKALNKDLSTEEAAAVGVGATTAAFTVGVFGKAGVRHLVSKYLRKTPRLF